MSQIGLAWVASCRVVVFLAALRDVSVSRRETRRLDILRQPKTALLGAASDCFPPFAAQSASDHLYCYYHLECFSGPPFPEFLSVLHSPHFSAPPHVCFFSFFAFLLTARRRSLAKANRSCTSRRVAIYYRSLASGGGGTVEARARCSPLSRQIKPLSAL